MGMESKATIVPAGPVTLRTLRKEDGREGGAFPARQEAQGDGV